MKEESVEMLRKAIEEVENGNAQYVILGILGPTDEDDFSICTGTREGAQRAENYLRDMLVDVASRPRRVRQ